MNLLHAALAFAAECHKDQNRDGSFCLPYLHHPLEVAQILRWQGGVIDSEILSAAILHDTVEEGGADFEVLEEKFGSRSAGFVRELTRTEPTPEQKLGLGKEEIYILRTELMLNDIRQMSAEAKTIKLADRISNLQEAILVRGPRRLARYKEQTLLILQEIPRETSPALWDKLRALCD